MANTYTSNTLSVSDGEITEHDTSKDAEINILSAECRWQGITTTSTTTNTSTEENYDEATAYWSDHTWSSSTAFDETAQYTKIDDVGDELDGTRIKYAIRNDNDVEKTVSVSYDDPTTSGLTDQITKDVTVAANSDHDIIFDQTDIGDIDHRGEYANVDENDGISGVKVAITYKLWYSNFNCDTAEAAYPAVPSGWNFDYHSWEKSNGDSGTTYTKSVGETKSIESCDTSNTVWVSMKTHVTQEETNYHYTTDPFVTRDVDGSYTGTLSDGEWSPWVTLNGLAANQNNEFYHNISGSNEANYEFSYDWEYSYPDALKQLRIYDEDQNAIHKVALADPTDNGLVYDAVRVGVGGTVYAVDVDDPGQSDTLDWTSIYHGTHGELALRAYDTIQL